MSNDLDNFFDPCSVAVVGASPDRDKVGYALLRNLLFGSGCEERDHHLGGLRRDG